MTGRLREGSDPAGASRARDGVEPPPSGERPTEEWAILRQVAEVFRGAVAYWREGERLVVREVRDGSELR
jgi:hypothetical protein